MRAEKSDRTVKHEGLGRSTAQRRAILDYLRRSMEHPTAEDVLREVNRRIPLTSRATVYNTLSRLKTAGMVREMHETGVTRYDVNTERHHHFVCVKCGRIEDVPWEVVPTLGPVELPGRKVETFSIILRGYCSNCHKAGTES